MSVTFDAVSLEDPINVVSSVTLPHTCSGANRLLLVALHRHQVGDAILAVEYDGVAMTRVSAAPWTTGDREFDLYYLLSPPTGGANVYVELDGSDKIAVSAISFAGVDQTTPLGTAVTDSFENPSSDLATVSGDMGVDFITSSASDKSYAPGAGQTERYDEGYCEAFGTGSANSGNAACSTEPATGTTTTMSWTEDSPLAGGTNLHVAIPVKQLSAGAVEGTAALTAPMPTLDAAGAVNAKKATAALTAPMATVSSAGEVYWVQTYQIQFNINAQVDASAGLSAPMPTVASAGIVATPDAVEATAALTAPMPTVASAGTVRLPAVEGTAALTAPMPTVSSTGTILTTSRTATAALSAPMPTVAAVGEVGDTSHEGTAALTAPMGTLVARARIGGIYLSIVTPTNQPSALFVADRASESEIAAAFSAGIDGFVRALDIGELDDVESDLSGGLEVTMIVRSRPFTFGDQFRRKRARIIRVQTRQDGSATAIVQVLADGMYGNAHTLELPASSTPTSSRARVGKRGQVLFVEFRTSDSLRLSGLELAAQHLREPL